MGQPLATIDEFRRGPALGSERPASWMGRVGVEPDQAPVLDYRDSPASGDAHRTICLNALRAGGIDHDRVLPYRKSPLGAICSGVSAAYRKPSTKKISVELVVLIAGGDP